MRNLNTTPSRPIITGKRQWRSVRRAHVARFLTLIVIAGCLGGHALAWAYDQTTYACDGNTCGTQAERNDFYEHESQ